MAQERRAASIGSDSLPTDMAQTRAFLEVNHALRERLEGTPSDYLSHVIQMRRDLEDVPHAELAANPVLLYRYYLVTAYTAGMRLREDLVGAEGTSKLSHWGATTLANNALWTVITSLTQTRRGKEVVSIVRAERIPEDQMEELIGSQLREPSTPKSKVTVSSTEDPVAQYLNEIGQYPLLRKVEEVRLGMALVEARVAVEGLVGLQPWGHQERARLRQLITEGKQAKEIVIKSNLRLVVSIAKGKVRGGGMTLLDLIQEGNIGLMHAVDKFDVRKGFKFSTYATWWIKQHIYRALDTRDPLIHNSQGVARELKAIQNAADYFLETYGREPTNLELADDLAIPEEAVKELKAIAAQRVDSLQFEMGEEGDGATLEELIGDPESTVPLEQFESRRDDATLIADTLSRLDERGAMILRMYYEQEIPLQEIADHLQISRERVRQLRDKALHTLRRTTPVQRLLDTTPELNTHDRKALIYHFVDFDNPRKTSKKSAEPDEFELRASALERLNAQRGQEIKIVIRALTRGRDLINLRKALYSRFGLSGDKVSSIEHTVEDLKGVTALVLYEQETRVLEILGQRKDD